MNTLPSACPICGGEVVVTRFRCVACDSSVEGQFQPKQGAFSMLSPEQLQFIEVFVKCEGKLNRMEDELNLSYPTLRSRLQDVIRALGFEPGKDDGMPVPPPPPPPLTLNTNRISDEQRRQILDDLDNGRITSEQAMKLLAGKA